ncbi:MAG: dihydroorotate dehydrogenase electron transfer subunit [Gammaproteobacteria bacterium]
MQAPHTRNTIYIEDARILSHDSLEGEQYILRLHAPEIAGSAHPGCFVHLTCHESLPMRRPMSIMRAQGGSGWIEILYKAHGQGTRLLSQRRPGEFINLIGPIGNPFKLSGYRKQPLLIGGGVGIPPMLYLAEHIKNLAKECTPLVVMGSELPFPFQARPSQIMLPGLPEGTIACMPLLEDWGIPSRLSSLQGFAGCYQGYVTDLGRHWLDNLNADRRDDVELFGCGPMPMLEAVARLADDFSLPCQLSLEEYMACAVGGCWGCAVPVQTANGVAMKRVCVDGPVFEAHSVFPKGDV